MIVVNYLLSRYTTTFEHHNIHFRRINIGKNKWKFIKKKKNRFRSVLFINTCICTIHDESINYKNESQTSFSNATFIQCSNY